MGWIVGSVRRCLRTLGIKRVSGGRILRLTVRRAFGARQIGSIAFAGRLTRGVDGKQAETLSLWRWLVWLIRAV